MRTWDLDMVRPQIAEFTLGGKIFKVFVLLSVILDKVTT